MRASGKIPSITALQIATASFAVPKSVMNTMVGRAAAEVAALCASAGDLAQPVRPMPATATTAKTQMRNRLFTETLAFPNSLSHPLRSALTECKTSIIGEA
jgi:hypothetical protein